MLKVIIELTSPTATTRPKRPRNATSQRKTSASATPVGSTAPKRRGRGRWGKKEEKEEEEEESEEEEVEETESVAETASVAETDGGPVKGLRTSSRRKGGDEAKSETSTSGRGGSRGRARARGRGSTRGRGRGH
jgi:hypothetical protein